MHFLQDVFQMTAIAFVSIINHYPNNGLHLFWDTLCVSIYINTHTHKYKHKFLQKKWQILNDNAYVYYLNYEIRTFKDTNVAWEVIYG